MLVLTQTFSLETTFNCMTIMRVNKTRVETRVNFLPCVFNTLHFIYFLCFFHKLLLSDVDSAFRTLKVESIVDISTNTLFTTMRIKIK